MSSRGRHRVIPISRRSRSAHQPPYQTITETYTKEITTRPPTHTRDDVSIPDVVYLLDESERGTPPLVRRRAPSEYPVFRVSSPQRPSSRITEIYKETTDFEEVERYTRTKSPSYRRSDKPVSNQRLPTYNVIPPTPEKNTARSEIPLHSDPSRRPTLPMYEEYISRPIDENLNPYPIEQVTPIPRPRSKSPTVHIPYNNAPEKAPRGNFRHIDSDSSEEDKNRYVYTHDVYVDSTTGRPYTPGRNDLDDKNCGKLKINVYFNNKSNDVEPKYTLDEIEIERPCIPLQSVKSRPSSRSTTSMSVLKHSELYEKQLEETVNINNSNSFKSSPDHPMQQYPPYQPPYQPRPSSRISTKSTLLRKENEILEVPLVGPLGKKYESKELIYRTPSERTIPINMEKSSINMDDIFPKMPAVTVNRRISSLQELQRTPSNLYEKSSNPSFGTKQSSKPGSVKEVVLDRSSNYERISTSSNNGVPEPNRNSSTSSIHSHIKNKRSVPPRSDQKPSGSSTPYEEVVHVKERYERDETIRRFYPTTTSV